MAEPNFDTMAIVGVGLLGGSLGLAAKAAGLTRRVVGIGRRPSSLRQAVEAGAVDETTLDLADGVAKADLVVLCSPVGQFPALLAAMQHRLKPSAIVTDVGSTKAQVVRWSERALAGQCAFVGSHPIAGGERTGPRFARADLYRGRTCILTPTRRTDQSALAQIERFWRALGMRVEQLSPAAHDRALARVSHLPHALATLLVNVQKPDEMDLAGTGFMDSTRIAAGDPQMWRDIFLSNRSAMLRCLDDLAGQLAGLRDAIDREDAAAIEKLLRRAQKRRTEMASRRLSDGRFAE